MLEVFICEIFAISPSVVSNRKVRQFGDLIISTTFILLVLLDKDNNDNNGRDKYYRIKERNDC